MHLERCFRLFNYLTLGLSCGALVYAEELYLPNLQTCLAPVLLLLLLAWWLEGRWSLPAWAANCLGACIAIAGVVWFALQWSDEDSLFAHLPMHVALLPYLGPLVMASLIVQVFRPRGTGDFWRLQGLGLIQVVLGCVLDGGAGFGVLFTIYSASALACLGLRHRLAVGGRRASRPTIWLVSFTSSWMLLLGLPALLLFLITPRLPNASWDPLNNLQAGGSPSTVGRVGGGDEINLNATGVLEVDDEVAFHVSATRSDGQPKLDLSAEQRWRGVILDKYANGKWSMQQTPTPPAFRGIQRGLPDFGVDAFYLNFSVPPRQSGALVLAEPIRIEPRGRRLPVISLGENRPLAFVEIAGTVVPLPFNNRHYSQYRQVVPKATGPERTPATGVRNDDYLRRLTSEPVPGLKDWTIFLLHRQATESRLRLSKEMVNSLQQPPRSFLIDPDHWEDVARVLTDYLARSGEYGYTLELTRQDTTIDPVMDFLINVKSGHCERFATALALMLRAVGIPARVVKGFRGVESQGDGNYLVRHRHAHAWVELLVPSLTRRASFDWLSLDPTPSATAPPTPHFSLALWWHSGFSRLQAAWRLLLIDYSSDDQADLWNHLLQNGRSLSTAQLAVLALAGLGAAALCFASYRLLRRWRAKRFRRTNTVAFYLRLTRILALHAALRPLFAQTPREFGEAARRFLLSQPSLSALADLPIRVVDLYYRVRFGGQPLSAIEQQKLDAEMDRFAASLRTLHAAATRRVAAT